ncbi:MAG: TlpA disulfide reductase family protein [Bryobacteraceae bacterium]|jgi:cytochrome c biogenesis protein CcmG/thiol:disulfide interchange protein DsbE
MWWKKPRMLEVGARAPGFQLQDLNGQTQSLQEILGRGPALLAFFKVSCPVCQFTFPFLQRLHESAGGIAIIGVSQDSTAATREYNAEFGVTFPTLVDDAGYSVSNAFGLDTVPSLFLIEPDGAISLRGCGFVKKDLDALGQRLGASPFRGDERIPEYKPG